MAAFTDHLVATEREAEYRLIDHLIVKSLRLKAHHISLALLRVETKRRLQSQPHCSLRAVIISLLVCA